MTPDALAMFDWLFDGSLPGGTYTSEQLRQSEARGILHVCGLEGVGVSVEDVLAEIERRSPGWPGHWTDERRIGPALST